VIGNGAYAHIPALAKPTNDAEDMAASLERLGFKVTLGLNASRTEMEDLLDRFARSAEGADAALVFYAGHGLQHQGVNYLAPVDAKLTSENDLRRFISVQAVLEDLSRARNIRVLILDACRDNEAVKQLAAALPKTRSAAFSRGLAEVKAEGTLVAFATQPDRVALDGEEGARNSPFTASLLRHLPTPGQDIRLLFTRVRSDVLKATNGQQRPETSDSLDGEFAFR